MRKSSKLALPAGLGQRQLTFQDLLWKLCVADEKEGFDLAAKFVTGAWALWFNRNELRNEGQRKGGKVDEIDLESDYDEDDENNDDGEDVEDVEDILPSSSQPSPANRSTGSVRTRGQLAAQRPPKMNLVGGKSKGKK
ncbi:hypothetical protein CMV_007131 [Castanea mollissima]|uniref:Uncharacterized protein n=1 Tax=Castanea mollissima TaxID=60419 RepID=A0A8J4VQI5_9ROSI|nr:hypothetical protein CMV_007131 [Castanea mollissima]